MRVDEFDYDLPRDMIAQHPSGERSRSRLLAYDRATGKIDHRHFSDIATYLRKDDVLVLNDSKVFPARLKVRKMTGGQLDVLLVRPLGNGSWECLARGIGKSEAVVPVTIGEYSASLKRQNDTLAISFASAGQADEIMGKFGRMPLPPYIKRNGEGGIEDFDRYQTVYAKNTGSIAAPTAGFHFSDQLLDGIRSMGIDIVKITLHIGIGTFSLIHAETLEEHQMHGEQYELDEGSRQFLKDARNKGRRIVACGTSSVRTLETVFRANGNASPAGRTELFIYPGYQFSAVDALITNFHLPRSTPLMLVAAFMGTPGLKKAYEEAISEGYRFYSYGDAMFIS
ncbi:MAG: tRNA preQ1(34) S-adenosylmethionine ribosyltransferase-isomerase QueA [Deltaproteobacteria bacterium]|nr:tRNA preQ1(34) S-adenosylmethionine ribosyltransferase-isomerase QueA [Deltaproteobacteria bacterium]